MKLSIEGILGRAVKVAFIAGVSTAYAIGTTAYAQSQDTAPSTKPTQLERVEVTGSRIKRVEVEGPSPVTVISHEDIERQNFATLTDILTALPQATGGTLNGNDTFNNLPGVTTVDLHGFGASHTLILVDGRRQPVFPFGGSVYDLSSIPAAIIERIEILPTGASAIYGSDAVSGVVNVITRKKYEGAALTARVGGTSGGGYADRRAQGVFGMQQDKNSLIVTGEYYHNNALFASQRDYAKSDDALHKLGLGLGGFSKFGDSFADGTGAPGHLLEADPNCGTAASPLGTAGVTRPDGFCGFNRASIRQLFPEQERYSVSGRFEHAFDNGITAFAKLGGYKGQTTARLEPFPYTSPLIAAGATNNPTNPANNPPPGTTNSSGVFARRLVEVGPRGDNADVREFSFLTGVRGNFMGYDWDVGLSRNVVSVSDSLRSLNGDGLNKFIDGTNGALNLFSPIPQSIVDQVVYNREHTGESSNLLTDFTVTGPIPGLMLPGGGASMSLHAEYEQQDLTEAFDPITLHQPPSTSDGAVDAQGHRNYYGIGAELSFPILTSLELDLAGRYDYYIDRSAVDGKFSPRIAMSYRPIDRVLLRASAGRSFRAPDMESLFGANATGSSDSFIDTPQCVANGGTRGDTTKPTCITQVQGMPAVTGSNANLKAEDGKNFGAGVVVEVIKDLTVSVDYYAISLDNIVLAGGLPIQVIFDQCATSGKNCGLITRGPVPAATPDNPNPIGCVGCSASLIQTTAINAASQNVRGFDTAVDYTLRSPFGVFKPGLNVAYITSLKTRSDDTSQDVENIYSGAGFNHVPKLRGYATLDWQQGPMGATMRYDFIGKIAGKNSSDPAQGGEFLSPYATIGLQGRYDFGTFGLVRVGVDNVFNTKPSIDPTDDNNQLYSQGVGLAYYSRLGRAGFIQYEVRFK